MYHLSLLLKYKNSLYYLLSLYKLEIFYLYFRYCSMYVDLNYYPKKEKKD